jgi:FAD-dependent sensor of blue light
MLQSLVYVSSAKHSFSSEDLAELLQISRRNNGALGVTGMLLYVGGNFMQALEGEEADLDTLYNRIAQDPRHRLVKTILRLPIDNRCFSGWSMGFKEASTLPEVTRQEISSFLDDSRREADEPVCGVDHPALRLLRTFAATMR